MANLKLGICLESLGLPLRQALHQATRLGVSGVQVNAVGDLSPNTLSQTGRREFRNLLRSHNLELTALGCPLRRGLNTPENLEPRIEFITHVMSLSFDLGPRIVIIDAGKVPEDAEDPGRLFLTEALRVLANHGDRTGTTLALETGLEPGKVLADFLATFDTAGLRANYDPGNLLVNGFDIYESLRTLRGRIVHAHAKDASASRASLSAKEVPVGQGDIDWMSLLSVFEEIEYRGWLAVERESGDHRVADVAAGLAFLRRFVG